MTVPPVDPVPTFEVVDADIWVGATPPPAGPTGATGLAGPTDFWFDTTERPLTGLDIIGIGPTGVPGPPTTGPTGNNPGDAWIDGDRILWVWDGEKWVPLGPISGPTGPMGPMGPASSVTGPTGPDGPLGPAGPAGPTGQAIQLVDGMGTHIEPLGGVIQRVDVDHDSSMRLINLGGTRFQVGVDPDFVRAHITASAGDGLIGQPTQTGPILSVLPVIDGGITVGPPGVAVDLNWLHQQNAAGNGLTADLTGALARIINVGAGLGITVDADSVSVDQQWLVDFINGVVFSGQLHAPVDVATTGPLSVGILPGAVPPVLSVPIDGVIVLEGHRVLVKDQGGDYSQNGIYTAVTINAGSPEIGLIRAGDADEAGELIDGSFVKVIGGIANGGTIWTAEILATTWNPGNPLEAGNTWSPQAAKTREIITLTGPTPPAGTQVIHNLNWTFPRVNVYKAGGTAEDGTEVSPRISGANDLNSLFITINETGTFTVVVSR